MPAPSKWVIMAMAAVAMKMLVTPLSAKCTSRFTMGSNIPASPMMLKNMIVPMNKIAVVATLETPEAAKAGISMMVKSAWKLARMPKSNGMTAKGMAGVIFPLSKSTSRTTTIAIPRNPR